MTKNEYKDISEIIKDIRKEELFSSYSPYGVLGIVASNLALQFRVLDPEFDYYKFMRDCEL